MQARKLLPLALSLILAFSGLIIVFISPLILKFVIKTNLTLKPNSRLYEVWKHFPKLVPIDFYFFNWTNPEEIYDKSVKPRFEQVGPYRFMVDLGKMNITWNENGTVTFRPTRYYWYDNEYEKNGDLQDRITTPNPVAVAAAHVSRTWTYMVRRGISFTLSNLAPTINITHTVDELLFTGYPDTLTKMAKTFPFFVQTEMPKWDRFGWFYQRNGTGDHEGILNVGTGRDSTFGKIYKWNYREKSPYYEGECADLDSSTGENFNPDTLQDYVKVFSAELCRAVILQYDGDTEVNGIVGKKYVLGDYMLDNGTQYHENICSCSGDCLPVGVFNVSRCRFGSPAFGSLPNFHRADPYFNSLIDAPQPEPGKHDFYVVIEPNTGFPLQIRVRMQINLMVQSIPGVTMFEDLPRAFLPIMWFDHQVDIPNSEISMLNKILLIPLVCTTLGILMIVVGFGFTLYLILMKKHQSSLKNKKLEASKINIVDTPEQKKLLKR